MALQTALLLFGNAGVLTATQLFIGKVVFAGVSMAVSSALTPKPDLSGLNNSIGTSIDPIGSADMVYGEVRKGGVKTYHETTGDGKFYHYFLTLSIDEVDSIGDIYINDEVATIDSNGFVTSEDWNSKILVKKFTGASSQNIYTSLVGLSDNPTNIQNTFKGQGVACLYVRLEYDRDVFQSGMPLITAVVKGRKVYDPRKDSTSDAYDSSLSVSTHRKATPSTWQHSSNPALCLRDYLTNSKGVNCDQSEVDDVSFALAADDCATTATGTENSFEIGGSVSTGKSKKSNINDLVQSLNGTLFWAQGKFRLVAGAYHAPEDSDAYTLDDVRGPISIQTRLSRRDLVNTVRGTFLDQDNRWIAGEFPQVQLADMSEDNDVESVLDLSLGLVTKSASAQRLAKQILYTSREQITLSAKFSMRAFSLQVGDTIKLTMSRYGWTNKVFVVNGWKASGGDGSAMEVTLNLQETSQEAYYWNVGSDEYAAITSNNTSLDDLYAGLAIAAPAVVSGTPVLQDDGTAANNLAVSWVAPDNGQVTHYEIGYKTSAATNYNTTTVSNTTFLIEPAVIGQTYDVRVRAFTSRGNSGGYTTATSSVVTGDTTAPATPTLSTFTATGGYAQVVLNWAQPSESDFRYVEVRRGSTVIGNSSGTSFVDGGLGHNTSYSYSIRAVDYTGNASSYTSGKSATTVPEVTGPTGFSTAQVFLYAAGETEPSAPTGTFTYTYATGALSGGTLGSWSTSIPELSTEEYLWVIAASAYSNAATDSIAASSFSSASKTSYSPADGLPANTTAQVFIFKKTTTTSVPSKPSASSTYTFTTGNISGLNNGWSKAAPSLVSGEYLWMCTAIANSSSASDAIAAGEWDTPSVVGIAGGDGGRGAGQWIINTASANMPAANASSSTINTKFTAAVATPVDKDQAWFTNETTLEQRVWIYDGTTWAYQTKVIDGNLLVDGTLTADQITSGTLDASKVTISNLTITDTLRLEAGGAGFIGGRDSQSAYDENGYFLATTDTGGGTTGYEASFTSVYNDSGTNRISGLIAKNSTQTKVFNPIFYTGGDTTGGTNSIVPGQSNNFDNLGNIDEVTVTVYGGGGGGGFGRDDGYSSSFAGSGGTTTATLRRGSSTGTILQTISANGGAGGANAHDHGVTTGEAGQSSDFGLGGAAGSQDNDGSNAPSGSWGAGGGGAGGDTSNWFDSAGGAGGGGSRGSVVSQTVDLSAETLDTYLVVSTFGAGGAGGDGGSGNFDGGNGAQGAVKYSSILGGTSQYTIEELTRPSIVHETGTITGGKSVSLTIGQSVIWWGTRGTNPDGNSPWTGGGAVGPVTSAQTVSMGITSLTNNARTAYGVYIIFNGPLS